MPGEDEGAAGTASRRIAALGPMRSMRRPRNGAVSSPPVVEAASTRLAVANEPVARCAKSTSETGAIVPAIPSTSAAPAIRGTPGIRSSRA